VAVNAALSPTTACRKGRRVRPPTQRPAAPDAYL